MIELINDSKYLSEEVVLKCFEKGKHLKVDKVVCGNGFTTAFFKLRPPSGMVNIIIEPNKSVIIEKERAYLAGELNTKNYIGFFYKEGTSLINYQYDVLVFVADSFNLYNSQLFLNRDKVNFVLIDEAHSIEIQSSFRSTLKDFDEKVKYLLNKNSAIVSVTASPNYYTKSDIKIINANINPTVIHVTNDRMASIERIKIDLKNKKKVVVATNSMKVLYYLRNRNRELDANYIIGTSLMRSCVTAFKVKINPNSNLIVLSSRGFEGFDIYGDDYKFYFFEDRARVHETFYISTLYQALNRTRNGASYIEYSVRYQVNERRKYVSEKDIDSFIDDTSMIPEKKQTKEFAIYKPYVIFNQDKEGTFTLKKDIAAVNLMKETFKYDDGFADFTDFLKDRKIELKYLNEKQKSVSVMSLDLSVKIDNLKSNIDLIKLVDLFGDDFKLIGRDFEKFQDYKKHVLNYLICKVYDSKETGVRELSNREFIGLNLFSNKNDFDNLCNLVVKTYNERSIEKYGYKASQKYREEFFEKSSKIVAKFIMSFINTKVTVNPNWSANRNYNIFTQIGIPEINLIGNTFEIEIIEIDIKSAFARILYACNDLDLPIDFYGVDKVNKKSINVMLNNFFYRPDLVRNESHQRIDAIKKLEFYKFDPKVINYLMENFFKADSRGRLFHFLSFHEKKIITQIKKILETENNFGVIRRHDSVILVGGNSYLGFLNDFEYLNKKGWFDIETKKIYTEDFEELINFKDEWE